MQDSTSEYKKVPAGWGEPASAIRQKVFRFQMTGTEVPGLLEFFAMISFVVVRRARRFFIGSMSYARSECHDRTFAVVPRVPSRGTTRAEWRRFLGSVISAVEWSPMVRGVTFATGVNQSNDIGLVQKPQTPDCGNREAASGRENSGCGSAANKRGEERTLHAVRIGV